MGRMSKHKAAKAAVTKRRKKSSTSASTTTISTSSSSSSGARRTLVSLAESVAIANANIGAASPTGSVSTAGSSTPSSSSSAKECEQCGNPTMLDGVAASRVWATSKKQLAANGCQICDFVTFRKSQRPCVHCERAACEHFCEWCGNGLHTKCARARDEKVNAPNGFCCRKCEAEQADDEEEKDPEAEELGSRCGSCRLPFNATGKDAESDAESDGDVDERAKAPEESGFKVNQSVLVENEEVLYNAVITEVDLAGERIKIHFIRWSKSFDNWYAMDDERINESLACDCCNRWFHIGCLPPIKSSGRFKDTTYVCPTCIDDAKHFHNGSRAKAKSASAAPVAHSKASVRKSSVSEDAPPAVPSKRKSSKPIVTSDDEQEAKKPSAAKKKRKLSNASDSPMKKKPEFSCAASRSRSKSPDAPTHAIGSATADADEDDDAMADDRSAARTSGKSAPSSPAQSPSHTAADDDEATVAASSPVASPRSTEAAAADASSSVAKPRESKAESDKSDASDAKNDKPSNDASTATNELQAKADKPVAPPSGASRRKLSSHSVSSLLNSPSPNEKPATPPLHPTMSSLSMLDENRRNLTSSFDVLVKTERSHPLPPLPTASTSSGSSSSTGRSTSSSSFKASSVTAKLESFTHSSNWSMRAPPASSSMKPSSGRGALSAFDILREVATQSIGGELDAVTTAPTVKPKKERQRASAAKAKAIKAEKAAAAAAEKAATAAAKSQSPNGTHGNGPAGALSEQERLTKERLQISNSFVDLHFSIRKEMYLKFCLLEEQGLLDRDTAQRLRSLIYPTSDKFQDLKFVYLVNKDLSPLYLTKRLLEVVPAALGGTGVASSQHHAPGGSTPGGGTNSVASSPAATTNHTAQPLPTIVPPGLTIPSFSEIIASEKAAALLHQQQQRQHQQLQQHLQQQHQTLQAAALATSGGLELCKKAAAAAAVRPDVLAKELAPLPSSSVMATSTSTSSSSLAPVQTCSLNRVIGKHGALPWCLPCDWAFFATVTRHQVLLVGRKSFEEFGKPVPNRKTIVVSPSKWQCPPRSWADVRVAKSLDHALAIVAQDPQYASCSRVFVGGGEQLYAEALARDLVESCIVTRVQTHIRDGDAFLPQWTHQLPTLAFCRSMRCRSSGLDSAHVGVSFQVWTK